MYFDKEKMTALVGCLRKPKNSNVPCSFITKLTLDFCYGVVNSQFIEFMQSKTIQWNNDQPWSSPLLELAVLRDQESSIRQIVSVMHGSIEELANEVNQDVQQWCPTIASQLTSLHIAVENDTLRLFIPNARRIRLEKLHLLGTSSSNWKGLANVIPHMPFLRFLCIETWDDPSLSSHIFLDAIRQSGNLHSASICQETCRWGENLCFHPDNVRWMNAYCERNHQTYLTLPEGAARWNSDYHNVASPLLRESDGRMLCPLLFTVAKQVPERQLNSWLTFLMKLDDAVGSSDSRKRSIS
jgi:hypothetical protein